jgi:hypothetical protein
MESDTQNGENERNPQSNVCNGERPTGVRRKTNDRRALQPHFDLAESVGLARLAEPDLDRPAETKNRFHRKTSQMSAAGK